MDIPPAAAGKKKTKKQSRESHGERLSNVALVLAAFTGLLFFMQWLAVMQGFTLL
jgi:hypothetical protein